MSDLHAHSGDRQRTCAFTVQARQTLNELRKNHLLCDARIEINDDQRTFPVHRFILASKKTTSINLLRTFVIQSL